MLNIGISSAVVLEKIYKDTHFTIIYFAYRFSLDFYNLESPFHTDALYQVLFNLEQWF